MYLYETLEFPSFFLFNLAEHLWIAHVLSSDFWIVLNFWGNIEIIANTYQFSLFYCRWHSVDVMPCGIGVSWSYRIRSFSVNTIFPLCPLCTHNTKLRLIIIIYHLFGFGFFFFFGLFWIVSEFCHIVHFDFVYIRTYVDMR